MINVCDDRHNGGCVPNSVCSTNRVSVQLSEIGTHVGPTVVLCRDI